jgi:hypothetical protein
MNNHTRNGKIARLSKPIREALNLRLHAGETGRSITLWLNELPEVRSAMDAYFEGTAIREQNISEWKKGGYEEWLRHQEALEVAEYLCEHGEELKAKAERMPMNEVLSLWLTSRYVVATKEIAALEGDEAWRKQRQMCDDLMKMRRAEQRDKHLQLERERVDLNREEVQLERERVEMERADKTRGGKGRPSNKGGIRDADEDEKNAEEGVAPEPGQRWEDISDEQKIVWARRPENLERINALTEAQKVTRWKEFLGISETQDPTYE